jgi:hypothetical protein
VVALVQLTPDSGSAQTDSNAVIVSFDVFQTFSKISMLPAIVASGLIVVGILAKFCA